MRKTENIESMRHLPIYTDPRCKLQPTYRLNPMSLQWDITKEKDEKVCMFRFYGIRII